MPPRTQPLLPQALLEQLYFEERLSLHRIADRTGTNYQWGGITRNYVPDVLITYYE